MLQIFLILVAIFILVSIVPFCQYIFCKRNISKIEYVFDKELFELHLVSYDVDNYIINKNIFDKKGLEIRKIEEYKKELP